MPTLIEYFNQDFKGLKMERKETIKYVDTKNNITIWEKEILKNCWCELYTGSRQLTYYISETEHYLKLIEYLILNYKEDEKKFMGTLVQSFFTSDIKFGKLEEIYSKRLFFYCENKITNQDKDRLNQLSLHSDCSFIIRDDEYLKEKININQPLAFISHDWNDKELIARPLAKGLSSRLCTVWYDEYSLKVGQSLRESIEKGIKEAQKCILILTPNFLKNNGWTKKEFNAIFTRELIFEKKLILPIWHNVTVEEIYDYSPSLVDTFALKWPNKGLDETEYNKEVELLISKLHAIIKE